MKSESEVAQLCPTLCDPMDCSLPGSSVHGILQARILEWVAISFSRGSSQPRESNPGLPHRRQMLYPLSHQGSSKYLLLVPLLFFFLFTKSFYLGLLGRPRCFFFFSLGEEGHISNVQFYNVSVRSPIL